MAIRVLCDRAKRRLLAPRSTRRPIAVHDEKLKPLIASSALNRLALSMHFGAAISRTAVEAVSPRAQ